MSHAWAAALAAAMETYPEIFEAHYGKYADKEKDSFQALNLAFAQDGFFIYVPDNVVLEKPMQMVSIINWYKELFIQTRNLVIMGRNSRMTMVHCDDSTNQEAMFKNSVTEVFIDEGASLEHYKLQNLNNQSNNHNYILIFLKIFKFFFFLESIKGSFK